MRNDSLEPYRQHRQRFAETEGASDVLRELEQRLDFLPRRRDGVEERQRVACRHAHFFNRPVGYFEARRWSKSVGDADSGREFTLAERRVLSLLLQFLITARENFDDLWIEACARFRGPFRHGFVQRQSTAVLPVGGQSIQAIHDRENARADRNFLAFQAVWIPGTVPALVMGRSEER